MADIPFVTHRQPRQFRRIDMHLTDLTDEETRQRYRFSTANIDRLVQLLGPTLQQRTRRNQALTPRQQILIALRFYATGDHLRVIGDTFGVDIATVSRVVTRVTALICRLKDRVICFPLTDNERRQVMSGFYAVRGFPSVIGCVDGTHVKIISPGQPDEAAYVNRKHQHSVNVQATCDHKGRITSINANWPGSCHDSHVFRTFNLCHHMETQHQNPENGVLLGDSGYPCRPFLLTPYNQPNNASEERYNTAHMSTRNAIERMFGVWKRTFLVLHSEIRMKPHKVSHIIIACAVLHNLRIMWNEPDLGQNTIVDHQPPADRYLGQMDGRGVRDNKTRMYFSN